MPVGLKEILKIQAFSFQTQIQVRITDLNYGNHVGNDKFVSILHEARVRFLHEYGFSELNFGDGSLILSDLSVKYMKQIFYPDILQIFVNAINLKRCSFNLQYKALSLKTGEPALLACSTMACIDYDSGKPIKLPESFANSQK